MLPPESFHILVTDCNHHIRNLLKRELVKEGYVVLNPKTKSTAYKYLFSSVPMDLIILDPQLFHPCCQTLISEIQHHHPAIQIIIHTYKEVDYGIETGENIHLVEKNAESIDSLTNAVRKFFLSFSKQ